MKSYLFLASVASAALLFSCGGSTGPGDDVPVEGIVRTNDLGTIISDDDPTDWVPRATGGSSGGGGTVGTPPTQGTFPAFPNPATASCSIRFALGNSSEVTIDITDDEGDVVAVLADNDILEAGQFTFAWNLTGTSGTSVPNGIYRVRLTFQPGRMNGGYWEPVGEMWTSYGDVEIAR